MTSDLSKGMKVCFLGKKEMFVRQKKHWSNIPMDRMSFCSWVVRIMSDKQNASFLILNH